MKFAQVWYNYEKILFLVCLPFNYKIIFAWDRGVIIKFNYVDEEQWENLEYEIADSFEIITRIKKSLAIRWRGRSHGRILMLRHKPMNRFWVGHQLTLKLRIVTRKKWRVKTRIAEPRSGNDSCGFDRRKQFWNRIVPRMSTLDDILSMLHSISQFYVKHRLSSLLHLFSS